MNLLMRPNLRDGVFTSIIIGLGINLISVMIRLEGTLNRDAKVL